MLDAELVMIVLMPEEQDREMEGTVVELVAAALATDDPDDDDRSRAVGTLHRRADEETFRAALRLTQGDTERERVLGADILGQLGYPDPERDVVKGLRARAAEVLIDLCQDDEPQIVTRAILNLGVLADPRGLAAVLDHLDSDDEDVRYAVAVALPSVTGWDLQAAGAAAGRIIDALIALSDDEDDDVRDWALFGLGRLEVDAPAIRETFVRHLDDPDDDARCEALVGLARLRDPRAVPAVIEALSGDTYFTLAVEAAAHLGDDRLLTALQELGEPDSASDSLHDALRNCDPEQRRRWEAISETLADTFRATLATRPGVRDVEVTAGREPYEYWWVLDGSWRTETGSHREATYDIVGLVKRLDGDLSGAAAVFESDLGR